MQNAFPIDFNISVREKHSFLQKYIISFSQSADKEAVVRHSQIDSAVKPGEIFRSPVMRDDDPRISL